MAATNIAAATTQSHVSDRISSTCICGGQAQGSPLTVGQFDYVMCADCGSGRLRRPAVSNTTDLYDEQYFRGAANGGYLDYDADAALHLRNARRRLDALRDSIPYDVLLPCIIDVGCASGYLLTAARQRGWSAYGVDVSAHAREIASNRGEQVFATIEEAAEAAGRPIDAVTFYQVLEHMDTPGAELELACSVLGPDGVIVVESWDVSSRVARLFGRSWQQANPPSVVHLFSDVGLAQLFHRSKVDVISAGATDKYVSVGTIAGIAQSRWPRIARALDLFLRPSIARRPVRYRLGDLFTVVGRVRRVS